jgi:hypothetical protein
MDAACAAPAILGCDGDASPLATRRLKQRRANGGNPHKVISGSLSTFRDGASLVSRPHRTSLVPQYWGIPSLGA